MKKQLLSFILLFCCVFTTKLIAQQENSLRIFNIVEPTSNVLYKTVDSTDFVVQVENLGPNDIVPADRFHITFSISDGSGANSMDFDTSISVGGMANMRVGEVRTYTLAKDIKFNGNGDFSARADVSGTDAYPKNTNKFSSNSTVFVVDVKEVPLSIENVYYAEGNVIFRLNEAKSLRVEIYDITGKIVANESFQNKKEYSFSFGSQKKGFYFMKVISNDGRSSTAKFAVH